MNNRNRRVGAEPRQRKPIYTYQFKVNKSDELLNFILTKIPMSRNSIKSLLSSNKVLVNGSVIRQFNYPLCKDDEVKISKNSVVDGRNPSVDRKPRPSFNVKAHVIYEDENYIAFDKPSGLLSVESDTDTESLYKYITDYLKKVSPTTRPYLLHRIDKDTSGVIVFSKSIELHSKLKMHWNDDVKLREYHCVIEGTLNEKKGTIKSYLLENQNNIVYSSKNRSGKLAITNYEVIKENGEYSLLKVTIDTGRKNQIRVHMKDMNHPIVGDTKYGNPETVAPRLMLHASEFDFFDPESNEVIKIKAPIPKEFKEIFHE